MNLCSDNHEEICFEGRVCPACDIAKERDEAQDELAKAEKQIDELQSQLDSQ